MSEKKRPKRKVRRSAFRIRSVAARSAGSVLSGGASAVGPKNASRDAELPRYAPADRGNAERPARAPNPKPGP